MSLYIYIRLAITIAKILSTILLGQIGQTHKIILYGETITNKYFTKILLGQIISLKELQLQLT